MNKIALEYNEYKWNILFDMFFFNNDELRYKVFCCIDEYMRKALTDLMR